MMMWLIRDFCVVSVAYCFVEVCVHFQITKANREENMVLLSFELILDAQQLELVMLASGFSCNIK